jgi:thiosulfate dehydrogenase (quinone) large subunit
VTTDEVAGAAESTSRRAIATRSGLGVTRIVVGWTFLWAFIDKVVGLGYATPSGKGWLDGGSPTKGLPVRCRRSLQGIYGDLAGTTFANWAFMLGLLDIGVAMTLGIGKPVAA